MTSTLLRMSAVKMPGPVRINRLASTLLDTPAPTELIAKAGGNSAVHHLAEKAKLRTLRVVPEGELRQLLDGFNTHDKAQGLAAFLTT
jgi:hypothetical protein